ncbi:sensor histidine kinase [Pelomonas sp. SE-A7]|uniref:histidine kinase n=1 Tax=Pelomonas sp. SE-A7 TaxID=3054953 RepID=UPI00259C684A|nr:sensor histidine kinase [Pelomonas sp. SE-A7]MDM4767764.1 histidine kinase [Pelomonas sp. SE-A7]
MMSHLLSAWRSLKRTELLLLLGLSLMFGAIDLSDLLRIDAGPKFWSVVTHHLVTSVAAAAVIMLCWLPADRSSEQAAQRTRRLVIATVVGSVLAALTIWELTVSLPWPSITELVMIKKKMPMPQLSAGLFVSFTLQVLLPTSLLVAASEMLRRQRRATEALQRVLAEQAQLRRRAMASRLAALQAQVEPQLLFDALVDVEQAYDQQRPDAALRMERLIRYLRVALPRLREAGSSLDAEAELLDSYLDVMRDLQPRAPQLVRLWADGIGQQALPPMLLLPLLQTALQRAAGDPPERCELRAERMAGSLHIELSFDRPGLCGSVEDLAELNKRLALLAGPRAWLSCTSRDSGPTRFTLDLPDT